MKKVLIIMLALIMIFALSACGGHPNEKAIVGVWHITDEETATEYGVGLEFLKDGTLRYGFTSETFAEVEKGDYDEAMEGLEMLMKIEYEILSDTEMEVTASALFGLAKESGTIQYSLDGDTLYFDGGTYTRVR